LDVINLNHSEINYGILKLKMKKKAKLCFECNEDENTLFRCKYLDKNWLFLCKNCLLKIKEKYIDSYCYGGTWKKYKKR